MRGPLATAMVALWALTAWGASDGGVPDAGVPQKQGPDVAKMPFTGDSIKQIVAGKKDAIQGCYEEMLASKGGKSPEGKLQAHWIITKEGVVKGAKIVPKGTTLKDPKLHECVLSVILSMEFPKPTRDTPIDFPFNLKALQ
jgi:hypothetical protein